MLETYIARQPIFDKQLRVYGYELLFRSSLENFYNHSDIDEASIKVIVNSYLFPGASNITEGKRAFINFTQDTLLNESALLLPPDLTVIELLETVRPDPAVLAVCRKAKAAGYTIALDDFADHRANNPLADLADIIKVDFLATSRRQQRELAERFVPRGVSLCAEKIETWEVFQDALEMGYSYFQGYFFGRPLVLSGYEIPATKLSYFHLLGEINKPDVYFSEIEKLIKRDLSLTYKLLRYINSAAFSVRREVGSIKQAVRLLGEKGIKKWITLIALIQVGEDCPSELVRRALIRAGICESMAASIGLEERAGELYLMGMCSCLDAILKRPLANVLEELPVANDIKTALLGGRNLLADIYKCVLAYEKGDWTRAIEIATKLKVEESHLPHFYLSAVEQSREVLNLS